jgi:type II secretory pathway component GspD/PulD (secretin)
MKRLAIHRIILAAAVILPLSGALMAGVDEVKAKLETERISLDLKNKPLIKVFQAYATMLGVEVHIQSCEKQNPISIAFDKITLRTSLNAICESAGLRWSIEPGNPPVLSIQCQGRSTESKTILSPMVSLSESEEKRLKATTLLPPMFVRPQLQQADLKVTLRLAARLLNAQLVMDGSLDGKTVTLERKTMLFNQFLETVCAQVQAKCKFSGKNPKLLIVEKITDKDSKAHK